MSVPDIMADVRGSRLMLRKLATSLWYLFIIIGYRKLFLTWIVIIAKLVDGAQKTTTKIGNLIEKSPRIIQFPINLFSTVCFKGPWKIVSWTTYIAITIVSHPIFALIWIFGLLIWGNFAHFEILCKPNGACLQLHVRSFYAENTFGGSNDIRYLTCAQSCENLCELDRISEEQVLKNSTSKNSIIQQSYHLQPHHLLPPPLIERFDTELKYDVRLHWNKHSEMTFREEILKNLVSNQFPVILVDLDDQNPLSKEHFRLETLPISVVDFREAVQEAIIAKGDAKGKKRIIIEGKNKVRLFYVFTLEDFPDKNAYLSFRDPEINVNAMLVDVLEKTPPGDGQNNESAASSGINDNMKSVWTKYVSRNEVNILLHETKDPKAGPMPLNYSKTRVIWTPPDKWLPYPRFLQGKEIFERWKRYGSSEDIDGTLEKFWKLFNDIKDFYGTHVYGKSWKMVWFPLVIKYIEDLYGISKQEMYQISKQNDTLKQNHLDIPSLLVGKNFQIESQILYIEGMQMAMTDLGLKGFNEVWEENNKNNRTNSMTQESKRMDSTRMRIKEPSPLTTLLHNHYLWPCERTCRYDCAAQNRMERQLKKEFTVKYNGRWSFWKVFGINELMSVLTSFLNLVPLLLLFPYARVYRFFKRDAGIKDTRRRIIIDRQNHLSIDERMEFQNPRMRNRLRIYYLCLILITAMLCNVCIQSMLLHWWECHITLMTDVMTAELYIGSILIYAIGIHAIASGKFDGNVNDSTYNEDVGDVHSSNPNIKENWRGEMKDIIVASGGGTYYSTVGNDSDMVNISNDGGIMDDLNPSKKSRIPRAFSGGGSPEKLKSKKQTTVYSAKESYDLKDKADRSSCKDRCLCIPRQLCLCPKKLLMFPRSCLNYFTGPQLIMVAAVFVYLPLSVQFTIMLTTGYDNLVNTVLAAVLGLMSLFVLVMIPILHRKNFGHVLNPFKTPSAYIIGLLMHPLALTFEFRDFPPSLYGDLLDAHATWHLATIPICASWLPFMYAFEIGVRNMEKTKE